MIPEITGWTWVALALALAGDALALRRRPFDVVEAWFQLTFTLLLVVAVWLAEGPFVAEPGAATAAVLGLGLGTKLLVHLVARRAAPHLRRWGSRARRQADSDRLYAATSLLLFGCYAALAARGGLSWTETLDARVDYTGQNAALLRSVRHWSPMVVVWGIVGLSRRAGRPGPVTRWRLPPGLALAILGVHVVAFTMLEGSKSAAIVIALVVLGASTALGLRLPRAAWLAAGVAAPMVLLLLLSRVAGESAGGTSAVLGLRLVSGSEGLLNAVQPPGDRVCEVDVLLFPLQNFFAKLGGGEDLTGQAWSSMGHCLATADPSYPWELLVPWLAEAWHVEPLAAPLAFVAYLVFAAGGLALVKRACFALRVRALAFPVLYVVAFRLVEMPTRGKIFNFLTSDAVSIALFLVVTALLQILLGREDAAATRAETA